jgi:hypothetical protein
MSNAIQQTFKRPRVFLPVIHPVCETIALSSIQIAVDAEADGIWLINQGMSTPELLAFIHTVNRLFPKLWIGVNLLGTPPDKMIGCIKDLPVGGIWSDNAGINEYNDEQPDGVEFRLARAQRGWKGLYFGGVAFKYQREVQDHLLPVAARKAAPWMDVITSSGPGTGFAASVEKVKALREGAGEHPMALSSGVSPENIDSFLPYVDAYLVASEIETEKYSGILVPERTALLSQKIHAWS